jgi:GNAT superfamily N-acetyltransferase
MMSPVEIVPLTAPAPAGLAAMTFPVYHPLLALEPTSRHPEQGDARRIQPAGCVALASGTAVGLVLGEIPLEGEGAPEMLSLFVAPEWRGQGIATALVAALELLVARRGFDGIATVYSTGKPSIPAFERVLWKRGWLAPEHRTLSVRFAPEAALGSGLFEERRMAALRKDLELFPWRDLDEEEKRRIREENRKQPWITPALAFWRFEAAGFEPVSSVGARYRGEVVGWVLNHRVSPEVVRFTCSFMRKDISRRGRIVPLYQESLRRMAEAGVHRCTFVTPMIYPNMLTFIRRWIVPIADSLVETRGSVKKLDPDAGPGAAP